MRRLSIPALVLSLFACLGYSSQGQTLSARQIVDQMGEAYASCSSYVDEGEVRIIFLEQKRRRTQVKPFSTAFVRPSDFRFEYKERRGEDEWNSYIIWRGEAYVKTWWSLKPGVENLQDLSLALGGAAGVSSGASMTIPSLLMPELAGGNRFKSLSELKLVGGEDVNGKSAYKIEAMDLRQNALTLWVDKGSLLLVRMYQKKKFANFETETTTTYKPQVNAEVVREKLAFNPPETEK